MTIQGDGSNNWNKGINLIMRQIQDSHSATDEDTHGPENAFTALNCSSPEKRRIDYIFTSRKAYDIVKNTILSDSKDCSYPSEHFPVHVELYFVD